MPDNQTDAFPLDIWTDVLCEPSWVRRPRALNHLQNPVTGAPDEGPFELALRYLLALSKETEDRGYDTTKAQVSALETRPREAPYPPSPSRAGWWLRWLPQSPLGPADGKGMAETIALFIQQTVCLAGGVEADVPGKGIRVLLRRSPDKAGTEKVRYQVLSSTADLVASDTAAPEIAEAFVESSLRPRNVDFSNRVLAAPFGEALPTLVNVVGRPIVLWPRTRDASATIGMRIEFSALASPGDETQIAYRLDAEVRGSLAGMHVEVRSFAPLVANCAPATGRIFDQDPPSATGDPYFRPGFEAEKFQSLRQEHALYPDKFVRLVDPNPLEVALPDFTLTLDAQFDLHARTDDFAGRSALYHCSRAFEMAERCGCMAGDYFHSKQFPVRVVHRAPLIVDKALVLSGKLIPPFTDFQVFAIGAQVVQAFDPIDGNARVGEIRFALADRGDGKTLPVVNPATSNKGALGAAADPRWVWHEFGHIVTLAGTGSLELDFAHSVGDALAAIQCDPESKLAWEEWNKGGFDMRGVTFPWVTEPLRRHDRRPQDGWSWTGTLNDPRPGAYPPAGDPGGYFAEQLMSSSLFRLYCAVGGDALANDGKPDVPRRRQAANDVSYLILWAVKGLGPIQAKPEDFVAALVAADARVGVLPRRGGALSKVIPWAFEQQGLYPPQNARYPWNAPGVPTTDVFLGEANDGGYASNLNDETAAASLMIEAPSIGPGQDAPPALNRPNLVRVFARNRGAEDATDVIATAWTTTGGAPIDTWHRYGWQPLSPQAALTPVTIPAEGGPVLVATFVWTPTRAGHHAVLVALEAPGDRSLLYAERATAISDGPTPLADFVPYDNNLGFRRWTIA